MRASVLLIAAGLAFVATLPLAAPSAPSEDVWRPAPFLTEPPSRVRAAGKSCFTEPLLWAARVASAAVDAPDFWCAPARLCGRNALPPLPVRPVVLRL